LPISRIPLAGQSNGFLIEARLFCAVFALFRAVIFYEDKSALRGSVSFHRLALFSAPTCADRRNDRGTVNMVSKGPTYHRADGERIGVARAKLPSSPDVSICALIFHDRILSQFDSTDTSSLCGQWTGSDWTQLFPPDGLTAER
jgi:hypothetical protein